MAYIIIKDSPPRGRTRTSVDREIQQEWGTSSFKSEEDADKCAFLERKFKRDHNADNSRFTAAKINEVK